MPDTLLALLAALPSLQSGPVVRSTPEGRQLDSIERGAWVYLLGFVAWFLPGDDDDERDSEMRRRPESFSRRKESREFLR